MRQLPCVVWIVFLVAACSAQVPPPSATSSSLPIPSAPNLHETGILLVDVGTQIQAVPKTEAASAALGEARQLAEQNGTDLGYTWIDPSSGHLVLSVVTQRGRDLVQAAAFAVPFQIRMVTHGTKELGLIQDDATFLGAQGVPGAELIFQTLPDERDNRALLVIRSMSDELLEALAERFPADALAIEVNAAGAP